MRVLGISGSGTLELQLASSIGIVDASGNGLSIAGGLPDIVTADWYNGDVSVFKNNGDGTFAAPVNYAAGSHPDTVAGGGRQR